MTEHLRNHLWQLHDNLHLDSIKIVELFNLLSISITPLLATLKSNIITGILNRKPWNQNETEVKENHAKNNLLKGEAFKIIVKKDSSSTDSLEAVAVLLLQLY